MVKKTKKGKDRLDKFYHLAKDQGYRARSAFKLIQLAKKTDFLSKSRICIDLCAAPGGWSQVAQRNMPRGSKIIAIDLFPIKPIFGVTCVQSDITSDKCRSILRKELQGQQADVVLHDGAPNVGTSWSKDAYSQAELTLHATKLACEHLRPGGTYVTKVFRSADYNSLLWVFHQLFHKVDATKPTASRHASAEIFVICSNFKACKIDSKFFEPKYVFMEALDPEALEAAGAKPPGASLKDLLKNQEKRHRSGYEEGDDLKIISASDFLASEKPAEVLVTHHRINLEAPGSEDLAAHELTTTEIRELCADLKILGRHDLSQLLKWRMRILRQRERAERLAQKEAKKQAEAAKRAAGGGPAATAAQALERDVNNAISELLEDGKPADDRSDGDSEAELADDALEKELAEQIEKRRREEKREKKKTMDRQKKREWRKKMSLGVTKTVEDSAELFKLTDKAALALEDQDKYIDPRTLDSDYEPSDKEAEDSQSESSSEEGLDDLAKLEVDVAVSHLLRKMRLEDSQRNKMQRKRKAKKETRRQRALAAWSSEFGAFSDQLDRQAAQQYMLGNVDEDGDDADDDEEDVQLDEDELQALRRFQAKLRAADEGEEVGGNQDIEALRALADGPPPDPKPAAAKKSRQTAALESELDKEGAEGADGALVAIENGPTEEDMRAEQRAARWFSQDIFQSAGSVGSKEGKRSLEIQAKNRHARDPDAILPLDRDSEAESEPGSDSDDNMRELDDSLLPKMPLTDKQKRSLKRKKDNARLEKLGKKPKKEKTGPVEVVPLEPPKPLVTSKFEKPTDPRELAETLALGTLLVQSKKSRMELIDAAYNRWTFDEQLGLPDWFTEDEERNNKPELPISRELMEQFRAKLREINARPIRKVAQARARKKRRLQKKLEKLRSTAMSLAETPDLSGSSKSRQMRSAISKMMRQEKRPVSKVAIMKGGGGRQLGKQHKVPKGAKVKVVDKRMKADMRGQKAAAKRNPRKFKAVMRKNQRKLDKRKTVGGAGGGKKLKAIAKKKRKGGKD